MKYSSLKQIQENLTTSDLNTMSRAELMKLFYKTVPAAQGRVTREQGRIEKDNLPMSISLGERMKETGGNPNFDLTPSKNVGKLKRQVAEAVNYLNNETSTGKGWQDVREKTASRFGMSQRGYNQLAKDREFWNTLNKLKEEYPNIDSNTIVRMYGQTAENKKFQELSSAEQLNIMRQKLNDLYEEEMAEEMEDEDFLDDFFN